MTFGGDVTAIANAAVVLSAGSGNIPALVLAGNGSGVQNISAFNGTTLTLPALAISATAGNVGNTTNYNGSVALGGATGLAAGHAQPECRLSPGRQHAHGRRARACWSSGATLAGGTAGLDVVDVNSGGVLQPDASSSVTRAAAAA